MRLCFVYEYYHPHVGGGEALLQHLAEGMAARGHECTVVTTWLPGTQLREVLNGVNVRRVRTPRFGDRYWFTFLSLPAILDEAQESDIIHVPTYNGAPAGWLAGRLRRKPVVLHPFEVLGRLWMRLGLNPAAAGGFMAFEKLVLALPFDAYGCISRSTRQKLVEAGVPDERAHLVYPGIDYGLFDPAGARSLDARARIRASLGVADDEFLCMSSGRPGYIKGLDFLARAIPEIRRRVPQTRFLFLLSPTPEKKYRQTVDLLPLSDGAVIVRNPVPRTELPLYFAASDCVVVPSMNEGFGFTAVEACTMERPVVVTRAGSLPEVVSGRYVVVEPGSAQAIAAGVQRVYEGDVETAPLKRFTWDDAIDRHLRICEDLLAARNRAAGASADEKGAIN